MYGAKRKGRIGQSLATIGAVWFGATVAGIPPGLFPWNPVAQATSLLLYAALLTIYALWTNAGRHSSGAYFLAGFLLPFVCVALLIMLPMPAPQSLVDHCYTLIFAGLNLGFQTHGGPDTPFEYYMPMMWLNLLLPIVAVIGGRAFLRYHRD